MLKTLKFLGLALALTFALPNFAQSQGKRNVQQAATKSKVFVELEHKMVDGKEVLSINMPETIKGFVIDDKTREQMKEMAKEKLVSVPDALMYLGKAGFEIETQYEILSKKGPVVRFVLAKTIKPRRYSNPNNAGKTPPAKTKK